MRCLSWILAALLLTAAPLDAGTRLSKAAIDGNLEKARTLVAEGERVNDLDKWGWTPLMWAVFYRQSNLVTWLLGQGADPNIASTKAFRSMPVGTTALGVASYYGLETYVRQLMEQKGDPKKADAMGQTPLGLANFHGFTACAQIMEGVVPADRADLPQEKLTRLFVIASTSGGGADAFLTELKHEIEQELSLRGVKIRVFLRSPLAFDEEQALQKAMEEINPEAILDLVETSAKVRKEHGKVDVRWASTAQATLRRPGNRTPFWEREIEASGSGIPVGPFASSDPHIGAKLGKALIESLEVHRLISPPIASTPAR